MCAARRRRSRRSARPPAPAARGDILSLRNSFEPLPLYEALGRRGFAHWACRQAAGDWLIFFIRQAPPGPAEPAPAGGGADEPAVRTLAALKTLPADRALLILTDRHPLLLYEALEEQGYAYRTVEASEGSYRTSITRIGGR